ncbi:cell wall metabolism sensor histidine kinase WalK [Nocardioides sp. LS1]|uniref:sensor histidine kinase n=1 Tax=Nocardioides sp. LS1 TaxID=1027620 RepID=UPI000F61E1ED|nr:GAF domain-containing sensor histidine kinase [Nocardioides sp. LS1]GCD90402.1 hypothetical protein NLS1_24080 [Nocardioides sp. LS1]
MTSEADEEIALLRRQLERERRARTTAETVGEQSTAQLYDAVVQLQQAEAELRARAEQQAQLRLVAGLVRQDLDPQAVLRRAVTAIGPVVQADRCVIRLADGVSIGSVVEQWSLPGCHLAAGLEVPPAFAGLCLETAHRRETLSIDDVTADPRIGPENTAHLVDVMGIGSYLGAPMWVAGKLVGWLALHAVRTSRPWSPDRRALVEQLASDLGSALSQAQAYRHMTEAVEHLEEANRVKSELVSTVSHELRTPLASINGYLEVLADEDLGAITDRQRRVIEVISRNGDRLASLVENLLTLARSDSGETGIDHTLLDLVEVVRESHRVLEPAAQAGQVSVRVVESAPSPVRGSRDELERLVINLVSNAIKFTPAGGEVSLQLTTTEDHVTLTVADTGVGIAAEDVPLVFDRFYRAQSATTNAVQGTGLGLAVVRTIVDHHAGHIELTSEPDAGTRVRVRLPRAVPAGAASA